jgi:putative cardiolipin synthase
MPTIRTITALGALTLIAACSTLPPGANYAKPSSVAYTQSEQTIMGSRFAKESSAHSGQSAFRMLSVGADGFALRIQMANAAQHTLDLQYFILTADSTGLLLTKALLAAADRGVRIRILVDDGATTAGDEQIQVLSAHPLVEVRIFNPFTYRGHVRLLRTIDFAIESRRLDYRMHNKLFVADNSIAVVGGRNIGDAYFQVSADAQYADDDVFVGGPLVRQLSTTFDEYWNSPLAIPTQALAGGRLSPRKLARQRERLKAYWRATETVGADYLKRAEQGDPLSGMLSGKLPLTWSNASVVCDSPEKKRTVDGTAPGRLMYGPISRAVAGVQSELLMITPYLIPTPEEMKLLHDLRARNVRVRVLTNSLNSTNELSAHSGYMHYRRELLGEGVELYEVRSLLGTKSRGSGQTQAMSHYGNYGLHAKLFVFDRGSIYAGSMNFDKRSRYLNTEIGLIIDSHEIAEQTADRFAKMTQPASSYAVTLSSPDRGRPHLVWRTLENDKAVEYTTEPSKSLRRRMQADTLSLLPIESEL